MTTMDAETFEILTHMQAAAGLKAPDPQQFNIVPRQPAAEASAETAAGPESAPTPGAEVAPAEAPAWDVDTFAAVPEEYRAAVMAGTAAQIGRIALEKVANTYLHTPDDVHRFVTDPERFVSKDGVIDRDAVFEAVNKIAKDRPELNQYRGERIQSGPGVGAGGAPSSGPTAETVDSLTASMAAEVGIRNLA